MLYHNSSIRCGRLNGIVWTGGSFDEMSNFMAKVRDLSGFEPEPPDSRADALTIIPRIDTTKRYQNMPVKNILSE